MTVRVLGFGPITDVLEQAELELESPATSGRIRERLLSEFPELGRYRFSLAVDGTMIGVDETITSARELALLPPFAGG